MENKGSYSGNDSHVNTVVYLIKITVVLILQIIFIFSTLIIRKHGLNILMREAVSLEKYIYKKDLANNRLNIWRMICEKINGGLDRHLIYWHTGRSLCSDRIMPGCNLRIHEEL